VRHLSRETGIRAPTLYDLEAGKRVNIGVDALARLAKFFGVTSDYLLDIDPENEQNKEAGAAAV
jgi:transcriptional regulator with XRE-family HTH domain